MEYSNLENENDIKNEMIYDFVEEIAPLVLYELITDDNCSRANGLSGLDQVILFQAGDYMDEIFNLDFVKAGVIIHIAFLRKGMQEREDEEMRENQTFEELIEEDDYEEYYDDDDGEFDEPYIDDPYKKPYIDDGYFVYEDDIYLDEDEDDLGEYTVYEFDDVEFQRKLRSIAMGYLKGLFTTDNPSEKNNMTGMEQVMFYASQLLDSESEEEDIENYIKIERKIQAYLIDFDGGVNLASPKNRC